MELPRYSDAPNLSELESRIARFADKTNDFLIANQLLVAGVLIIGSILFFTFVDNHKQTPSAKRKPLAAAAVAQVASEKMADTPQLDAPKETLFTTEELKQFNGSDESKPIYVAIKGQIFDVSAKRDMYGPGAGYNVFAGKDGSAGLGKSSLKPEDAISDYSKLDAAELKVLDDWVTYFTKRYNIIGKVVD